MNIAAAAVNKKLLICQNQKEIVVASKVPPFTLSLPRVTKTEFYLTL